MLARAPFNLKQGSETVESYFGRRIFVLYQSIHLLHTRIPGQIGSGEEVALAARAIHLFEVTVPVCRGLPTSLDCLASAYGKLLSSAVIWVLEGRNGGCSGKENAHARKKRKSLYFRIGQSSQYKVHKSDQQRLLTIQGSSSFNHLGFYIQRTVEIFYRFTFIMSASK